eukprot:scaffold53921_cov31-Tisochrysis_lutea.AAC.1
MEDGVLWRGGGIAPAVAQCDDLLEEHVLEVVRKPRKLFGCRTCAGTVHAHGGGRALLASRIGHEQDLDGR